MAGVEQFGCGNWKLILNNMPQLKAKQYGSSKPEVRHKGHCRCQSSSFAVLMVCTPDRRRNDAAALRVHRTGTFAAVEVVRDQRHSPLNQPVPPYAWNRKR